MHVIHLFRVYQNGPWRENIKKGKVKKLKWRKKIKVFFLFFFLKGIVFFPWGFFGLSATFIFHYFQG